MRRTTSSWLSTIAKLGFKRSLRRPRRGAMPGYRRSLRVEPLEDRRMLASTADIVFLVDESGSTGAEHAWVGQIALKLDASLEAAGLTDIRYGLVGFGTVNSSSEYAHSHLLGEEAQLFSSAEDLATGALQLSSNGGGINREDGWDAIEHALSEYRFRNGAVVQFVLVTDQAHAFVPDAFVINPVTREGILAALNADNAILNSVVDATFQPPTLGDLVLGVEADQFDGVTDGSHIAHVFQPSQVSDPLQISFNGSNIGLSGWVASNKSIRIGADVEPGLGPNISGYSAELLSVASFEDIDGSPNVTSVLTNVFSNEFEELDSNELGDFSFNYFGETHDHLFVSLNGYISFDVPTVNQANQDLTATTNLQELIAVLWDDLATDVVSTGSVLWEVRDVGLAGERLIVQWNDVTYFNDFDTPNAPITFQAILYGDGRIQFNYQDIGGASDPNQENQNNAASATVGIIGGVDVSPLFVDGINQVNGEDNTEDDYVRLAWDTDGAAWNVNVIRNFAINSTEVIAFDQSFVASIVDQSLTAISAGNFIRYAEPVIELNVGGPTVGEYDSDSTFAPDNTSTVVPLPAPAIDETSNSNPDNVSTAVFQTAREADIGFDMNWSFDSTSVPNGKYVVELLFAEIDPDVMSSGARQFDLEIEGIKMLDNYDIFGDRTKIETAADEAASPNSRFDVSEGGQGTATTKRFEINVTDGNGLQIDLLSEIGRPLLSGLRILDAAPSASADFDADGDVDGNDFLIWQRGFGISSGALHSEGDANYDGMVDGLDLAIWQAQYGTDGNVYSADFDADGDVDGADFLTWQRGFGITSGALPSDGDANFDGKVDGADLAVWQEQYGSGSASVITTLDADYDDDGYVTALDYMIWQENLGLTSATNADGDANGDGLVNGRDLLAWELEYTAVNPNGYLLATTPVYAAAAIQPGQILVSTLADELDNDYSLGDLSLREALLIASQTSAVDTIVFAVSGTIVLDDALGQLVINSNLLIDGPGAGQLAISGNDEVRVLSILAGVTASIEGVTITGGRVTGSQHGGGINNAGDLTLREVEIVDNFSASNGGGIYSAGTGSALRIYDSTIAFNQAGWGAGMRVGLTNAAAVTIVGSTIHSNIANNGLGNGVGGGVYFTGGAGAPTAYVVNTTLSGNSALQYSGGMRAHLGAVVSVASSTITQNYAGLYGGGFSSVGGSSTTFVNSIVVENTAGVSNYNDGEGSFLGGTTFNLIGRVNGTTYHSGPFGLGSLSDNGGPTWTHAIASTSPALNAGNNAAAAGLDFDQRGSSRLVGGIVDIGAVEHASIVVSTLADEDDTDYSSGDLSLREAIRLAGGTGADEVIEFAPGLSGTISLGDMLSIGAGYKGNLTIRGAGSGALTIDAGLSEDHVLVVSKDSSSTIETLTISDLRLTGATVAAIATSGYGADVDVIVERLEISDNDGAAISIVTGGDLTVVDTAITRNSDYGIWMQSSGVLLVSGSAIYDNDAVAIGLSSTFDATVENSTLSGNNSSNSAGGILLSQFSSVVVRNSTITDNTGTSAGGILALNYGLVELHNSIVAGNYDSVGASDLGMYSSWFMENSSNNLIGVDESGAFPTGNDNQIGVSMASLRLAPLADNGGPTRTHALMIGSIAINAGNNSAASELLYDQRGFARLVDEVVDIGAFEYAVNADFDTDGDVDGADFLKWQQGYGITSGALHTDGDANFDGMVDGVDLAVWQLQYGTSGEGLEINADFDADGDVDGADFLIWQTGFGITSGATLADGDADGDGDVDSRDLLAWEIQYGTVHPNSNLLPATMVYSALNLQVNEILVSTLVDESDGDYSLGDLSLREALELAAARSGVDHIVFDPSLASGTITLQNSLDRLVISSDVEIHGLGADLLTIHADGRGVFLIDTGVEATIRDLKITGGYAMPGPPGTVGPFNGGGVYNRGDLILERVLVTGNTSLYGGGIAQETSGASLLIIDSTIAGNYGYSPGGGLFASAGTVDIVSSTFSNNNSSVYGGGIYVQGTAALTLFNTTLSGNQKEALRVSGNTASVLIVNSTIANNTETPTIPAAYTAGGVNGSSGTIKLVNTIVAGNTGGDINGGLDASSHHNLIGNGSEGNLVHGTNNNMVGTAGTPLNARLTTLGNYGGPTQTHALLHDSPAIDAGDNDAVEELELLYDQRGFDRIVDWDGIGGNLVDIGAVELAFEEVYS